MTYLDYLKHLESTPPSLYFKKFGEHVPLSLGKLAADTGQNSLLEDAIRQAIEDNQQITDWGSLGQKLLVALRPTD